jgi:hypothetical protein
LESCYITIGTLILKHQLKTVALCGISTGSTSVLSNLSSFDFRFFSLFSGIFGYPLYPATHVALKIMRQWLETDENWKNVG